jgi:hypothetical protein
VGTLRFAHPTMPGSLGSIGEPVTAECGYLIVRPSRAMTRLGNSQNA